MKIETSAQMNAAVATHAMGLTVEYRTVPTMQGHVSAGARECAPDGASRPLRLYCSDPAASWRLEEKMRELGWAWLMFQLGSDNNLWNVFCGKSNDVLDFEAVHPIRFVAMAMAALSALGIQAEYVPGWWTK